MPVTITDRRILARRAEDKLPVAPGQLRGRRLPQLMVIVSATVCITPEARATVEAGQSSAVFTKTYSKDELKQTIPANPVTSLGDRLMAEVTEVFKAMTAAQAASYQKGQLESLKTKQADKFTWDLAAASLRDAPTSVKADADKLRTYLSGETQKATSSRVGTYLPVIDKLKSGLSMNLDLSSASPKARTPPASGKVRYGLVLTDITPASDAYDRASLGDPVEEMVFAGHADVHWTIGAIDEEQGRHLFSFDETSPAPADDSLWNRVRVPKMNFTTKIKPENVENFATLKAETMPIWRLDLDQSEGYFNLTYRTKSNGKRVTQEETVKIPLAGTVEIGRRFSDKWDTIQTSAYNILFDKRLPLVSVHYMHIEERFKGEVAKQLDPASRIALTAKGQAQGSVLEKGESDRPAQYSLEYIKAF